MPTAAHHKILVVDDERMIRWSVQQALAREGLSAVTAETGEEALALAADQAPDLVLLDVTLPGIDGIETLRRLKALDPSVTVVMVTAVDDLKTAVETMRLGAYDYVSKPFDLDRLKVIVLNALDRHDLTREVEFHRKESVRRYGFHRFVGTSEKMRMVLEIARKVSRSEATTVLLQGESGTGKDLLALAIHYESARANRPFMPINCTALPEELLESELMGHEKGAFTDAKVAKKGLFEVADGGTVFLDEIGDMKPGLQAKLLRFIENKTYRRVGGHRDIEVDIRIIAATNRMLEEQVRTGAFREDLYFRLNVFPIFLPPLRDRREDILPLAEHFLRELSKECRRPLEGFSDEAGRWMVDHPWPGNVRELRNAIERAIILGEGPVVELEGFYRTGSRRGPGEATRPERPPEGEPSPGQRESPAAQVLSEVRGAGGTTGRDGGGLAGFLLPNGGIVLEKVEEDFIRQALERFRGNQTRAAEALGLTRDALRYRMKKFGFF